MKLRSSLEQRKKAGRWLKGLRVEAELTQLELAGHLGLKYYAFISQVELGLARVPPSQLEGWARALNINPGEFAWRLLAMYEPDWHRLLYAQQRSQFSRHESGRRRNA